MLYVLLLLRAKTDGNALVLNQRYKKYLGNAFCLFYIKHYFNGLTRLNVFDSFAFDVVFESVRFLVLTMLDVHSFFV